MKVFGKEKLWNYSSYLKNNNFNFNRSNILKIVTKEMIEDSIKVISNWNDYQPTPLIELNKLANLIGVKKIYYKDESKRFTLKSFKALGGAFAVEKVANGRKNITVATATAGNHGRSVAWGAQKLGLNCKIFISEYVSESRANAMREFGANVVRVKGNYDNSLKECIAQSQKNNWEIVQDTAWSGYELIPQYIMAGYTIMMKEIFDQINNDVISHVFLQAGVGGMAGAMIAGIVKFSNSIPKIIIVEPEDADCVLKSIKNNEPTTIKVEKESIMGGMSCGEVSKVAWNILKLSTNYCVTIPDTMVARVSSLLANKKFSKNKIEAGECATPGIIALKGICFNQELKNKIKLNKNSKVLVFGCEGATDEKMYNKLLKLGSNTK